MLVGTYPIGVRRSSERINGLELGEFCCLGVFLDFSPFGSGAEIK